MSDAHKAALAAGRTQSASVRRYLEALEANKPKRGRKRTQESVERQLAEVKDKLRDADPLARLQLTQARMDLEAELERMRSAAAPTDLTELERDFVEHAKAYSESKGISYAAWRALGVPPAVLKRAGITRAG